MRDAATWAVPAFAGAVALWFLVGWLRDRPHERRGALTALLAAGGALLANQAILLLWDRPRPFDAHPAPVTTLVGVAALLWWPLAPVTARLSRLIDGLMRLLRLPLPDRSAADLAARRVTS